MQTAIPAPFQPEPNDHLDTMRVIGLNEVLIDWSTVPTNEDQAKDIINSWQQEYDGDYVRIDLVQANGQRRTLHTAWND